MRIDHEQLLDLVLDVAGQHQQPAPDAKAAVEDAREHHRADIRIEPRIEHQRPRRGLGIPSRRRHALDDPLEQLADPLALLRRDHEHVSGVETDHVLDLAGDALRIGGGQVDLVHHGHDLEVVLDREVGVRERLRLDSLRRIDHEHGPFARLERPRDLVGEVHVARRIDEVQLMALPGDAHGLGLDRDPALALEIHRIEQLLAHVAVGDRVRELKNPIGQGRLPVVDVGDDGEVSDAALVHGNQARMLAVMRFCPALDAQ